MPYALLRFFTKTQEISLSLTTLIIFFFIICCCCCTVMEMNVGENGGAKQNVNGGGGEGRGNELTQKKNKQVQRGMGVYELERQLHEERRKKMTEVPWLHPLPLPSFNSSPPSTTLSLCASVPNGAVSFRPAPSPATPTPPGMLFHAFGIHGQNLFTTDHHVMDPSVIGSRDNVGSKFFGNNTVVDMIDAGRNRRCAGVGQVTEVMSVHRNGGNEWRRGGVKKDADDDMVWEWEGMGGGANTSVGGEMTGLRGGDGSCVTAITVFLLLLIICLSLKLWAVI